MRVPHVDRQIGAFLDDIEVPAFLLAPLLALLLASAMFLPNQFARTSWSFKGMGMIDSPAGYVGVLSLWGCIACVALVAGFLWRRWGWIAMLVAAGGFAGAAVACIGYWQQLARGINLVDGTKLVSDKWMTHYTARVAALHLRRHGGLCERIGAGTRLLARATSGVADHAGN